MIILTGARGNADDPAPRAVPQLLPGAQPGGQVLLSTQWSLRPVGKQVVLGDFPVNIVLHPRDEIAAVLHAGYGEHEIVLVDLKSLKVVSRSTIPEAFTGLCFTPDGETVVYSASWDGGPVELYSTRPESPESRPLGMRSAEIVSVSRAGEMALAIDTEASHGDERVCSHARQAK